MPYITVEEHDKRMMVLAWTSVLIGMAMGAFSVGLIWFVS